MSSGASSPAWTCRASARNGVEQLVAAAVVEGHQQGQPGVVARSRARRGRCRAAPRSGTPCGRPMTRSRTLRCHQLGQLARRSTRSSRRISVETSSLGAVPVLRREGVEREEAHARARRRPRTMPRAALTPSRVPGHPRQPAAGRPPAVAVHDDGDVRRARAGPATSASNSCSPSPSGTGGRPAPARHHE